MYKKLLIVLSAFLLVANFCSAQCTATITASGPTTFCAGGSVTLTSSLAYTYQWYQNGTAIPSANSSSITVNSSGSYTVVDSMGGTCVATSAATVVVVDPLPTATISGPSSFCQFSNTSNLCANICISCSYQWYLNSIPIAGVTAACITPPTSGNYSVIVTDGNGCSATSTAISATVYTPPTVTITANPSTGMYCSGPGVILSDNVPCPGCTYQWYLNGTALGSATTSSYTATAAGIYKVTATSANSCDSSASFTVVDCDSLFPGDVNYDHVVDNTDALDLALGYGSTGSSRAGATISWVPQYCANWGSNIVPGVDMKNADCDGNGTVDANDTAAIAANYGSTHPKGTHHAQAKITGLPDLYFDLTGVNIAPGNTVSIPIKFGTPSLPMNNILGIAAHVRIAGITPAVPASISYPISWLGTSSSTFSFRKPVNNNGIDWAYARNDRQNTSGSGTLANLTFTIPANAGSQQMVLYFEDVMVINKQGLVITGYNVLDDSAFVQPLVCCSPMPTENFMSIVPNPSSSQCELLVFRPDLGTINVKVTDVLGNVVWTYTQENVQGNSRISLPAPSIASGVYMVQVNAPGNAPHIMKWVKN